MVISAESMHVEVRVIALHQEQIGGGFGEDWQLHELSVPRKKPSHVRRDEQHPGLGQSPVCGQHEYHRATQIYR